MGILEDKIREFLSISSFNDASIGSGYCYNHGYGYGSGYGCGKGGDCADGYGDIIGIGSYRGDDFGYGDGCGSGGICGNGRGFCYDICNSVREINGNIVYIIDDTSTIITSVHSNIAKGFIVQTNLQLIPCYIVKDGNKFAHGSTIRDAFNSLQEKLYDDKTEEERIKAFKNKFPNYDVKYSNRDLFVYHHILTGSCRIGRETFVAEKGLSLDGNTSVREFIELTKDAYGGNIIRKLPSAYCIKQ